MYDIFSTRTVPQCSPILHRKLLFELAWAVMPCSAFGIGNSNRATHCVGVAPVHCECQNRAREVALRRRRLELGLVSNEPPPKLARNDSQEAQCCFVPLSGSCAGCILAQGYGSQASFN
jgi:hypothetical protein